MNYLDFLEQNSLDDDSFAIEVFAQSGELDRDWEAFFGYPPTEKEKRQVVRDLKKDIGWRNSREWRDEP
jgi:hypothetical protein